MLVRRAILPLALAILGASCGGGPQQRTAEQYSFPKYPPGSMRQDASVTCRVHVTAAGDVADVEIVAGSNAFFDPWVESALREWKYSTAEAPSVETIHVAFRRVPPPEPRSGEFSPAVIFKPPNEVIVIEEVSNKVHLSH